MKYNFNGLTQSFQQIKYNQSQLTVIVEYYKIEDSMSAGSSAEITFQYIHDHTPHKHSSAYKSTHYASQHHSQLHNHSLFQSQAVSKLQDARRNIDQVIQHLTDKKNMNQSAVELLHSTNQQILQKYGRNQSKKDSEYGIQEFEKSEARTAISGFQSLMKSQSPNSCGSDQIEETKRSIDGAARNSRKVVSRMDYKLVLRAKLNEKLRINNELIAKLKRTKELNKYLRSQGSRASLQNQTLKTDNQSLLMRLCELQEAPYRVMQQLQLLKDQNDKLRKDTILLLQTGSLS